MSWTRRKLLAEGAKLALVVPSLAIGLGCGGADSCVDPDRISTAQVSLRASFHFTERSPHGPEKECAGCAFFSALAGDPLGCGSCRILQGPANPRGHCDSWSPRAA